ncbi:MAG: hypothetical protein ABI867_29815 [Kofleriaceae bacterium]
MRLLAVVLLLVGCKEDLDFLEGARERRRDRERARVEPPAPPVKRRPLEVTWKQEELAVSAKAAFTDGGELEVSGYKGAYHITLRELRKGGTWKIGARSGKTDTLTLIDLPIADRLGTYTFEGLKKVDPKASLELALADGRNGVIELPPIDVTYMIEEVLANAEHGPVTFGAESADPKPKDSMFWVKGLINERFIGKAGKLSELDWVLVTHLLPDEKGRKTCGGYKDSKQNPIADLTLLLKDTEATIYDRRTGDIVEKKLFPPDPACPMFTFRKAGDPTGDSSTPYQAIAAWARSRIVR